MPGHRSQEAGSMRRREAIRSIAELNEQVEDSSRERPSQSQETTQLRWSEIGHEKGIGAGREWRLPPARQVILPESHDPARVELLSHHADRERRVSRPGGELEITEP